MQVLFVHLTCILIFVLIFVYRYYFHTFFLFPIFYSLLFPILNCVGHLLKSIKNLPNKNICLSTINIQSLKLLNFVQKISIRKLYAKLQCKKGQYTKMFYTKNLLKIKIDEFRTKMSKKYAESQTQN